MIEPQDDCLLFAGAISESGYGTISVKIDGKLKNRVIHRILYELKFGVIPDGLVCDHKCRIRRCINLSHIQLVTNLENLALTRIRATACRNGHEYTEDNLAYSYLNGVKYRRCRICSRTGVSKSYWRKKLAVGKSS